MDNTLNLILCVQGHLPTGAAETEFEEFYCKAIKPLVSALDKFPRINVTFHYSGVILNWIERRHPELFMLIEDLLSRKQAEFLGGGFYNPILPILPLSDKIGQIDMLTTYLRKHFGKKPQGCWLPAMAWEQNLVGPLTSCGMAYTFLDDMQFFGAGVKPCLPGSPASGLSSAGLFTGGLYSPCVTEDQGKLITVFPVAGALGRELRKDGLKTLEELLKAKTREFPAITLTLGETGEEGAYADLFGELSAVSPNIEFTSPAKLVKNLKGLKKVYFPGVWAPRQFLADHSEAGGIYAKMIYVHTLINNQLRGDKTRKRTATEELWKAQDSSILNLGSFGLMHSPVRKAAYRSLLEAEKITREKGKLTPSLSVFDFNLDGEGEYIFQDDKITCCIQSRGAGLFELDYLPCTWNYLDTLSSSGSERRCAFADWLAPEKTAPVLFGPAGVTGGRFCGEEDYEVSETDRIRRRAIFNLPPKPASPCGEIGIEKTWQLKKNSIALDYVLKNYSAGENRFIFSPSIDLSFPGEGDAYLRVLALREEEKENIQTGEETTVQGVKALEFQDIKNEAVISLEANRFFNGRIFHIRSGPPGREEYQSTCLMPMFTVSLEGGKTWKTSFSLKISS